jgi:uncharacterized protein (UPF0335 family)
MTTLQASSQQQLRQYIEQLERIEDERLAAVADFKEKMAEIKSTGFDPKIVRKVLAIRKKDKTAVEEEEALLDVYLAAVQGSFDFDLPAGSGMTEAHA